MNEQLNNILKTNFLFCSLQFFHSVRTQIARRNLTLFVSVFAVYSFVSILQFIHLFLLQFFQIESAYSNLTLFVSVLHFYIKIIVTVYSIFFFYTAVYHLLMFSVYSNLTLFDSNRFLNSLQFIQIVLCFFI